MNKREKSKRSPPLFLFQNNDLTRLSNCKPYLRIDPATRQEVYDRDNSKKKKKKNDMCEIFK